MAMDYAGSKWRYLYGCGGMSTQPFESGDPSMDNRGLVERAKAWHRVDDSILIPKSRWCKSTRTPEGDFGRDG